MKKKLACLALAAPLLLLTACSGGAAQLSFQSNWYGNSSLGSNIEETLETLEYAVTFDCTPQRGLSVSYDGTFKTKFYNDRLTLEAGQQGGYVLETELTLAVKFTYNGEESPQLTDSVVTRAEFLPVGERLRPVRSERTVRCNFPAGDPSSLDSAYQEYRYGLKIEYNDALTSFTSVYTDLAGESEPTTSEHTIKVGATYLDNEELFIALRGLDMKSAVSFRSYNYVTDNIQALGFRATPTETKENAKFEMNGAAVDESIDAYSADLSYSGTPSGQAQTLVFAKKTSDAENRFRNVILRMEVPISNALGTLRFTLTKAQFTAK